MPRDEDWDPEYGGAKELLNPTYSMTSLAGMFKQLYSARTILAPNPITGLMPWDTKPRKRKKRAAKK